MIRFYNSQTSGRGGFSLIEMAILLVVAGTVMLGAISAIRSQASKTRVEKTQQALREIDDALLGFVTATGHLPCPDWFIGVAADGRENRDSATGVCVNSLDNNQLGLLPWQSLGIKPMDQWGHFYSYRVSSAFTVNGGYTFNSNGDMTIFTENGDVLVSDVPVVVVSSGPKGLGAYVMSLEARTKIGFTNATMRERENIINDGDNTDNVDPRTFFQAGDDILMWIPPNTVKLLALVSNWLP
ncbi:MAG TPA: type II secretion system protein [Magnetococcales bacterium]|nr:type II secretion system protein [Magnetococcales bacterium]